MVSLSDDTLEREAMWINFKAKNRFIIKVYAGGINAVSGEPAAETMATNFARAQALRKGDKSLQDYMVVPEQYWLDGISVEPGKVRQFVAMPFGSGFSVEAQITGREAVGGIQFEVTPTKAFCTKQTGKMCLFVTTPDRKTITIRCEGEETIGGVKSKIEAKTAIPKHEQRLVYGSKQLGDNRVLCDEKITEDATLHLSLRLRGGSSGVPTMSIAAGGHIDQCVQEDDHDRNIWAPGSTISFSVHILNSQFFQTIMGKEPPPTPITMKDYLKMGLPFFNFKEPNSIVSGAFGQILSVGEIEFKKGKKRKQTTMSEATVAKPPAIPIEHFLYHVSANPNGTAQPFRTVRELEEQIRRMNVISFD